MTTNSIGSGKTYAGVEEWWVDVDVSASDWIGEITGELTTTSQLDCAGTDGTSTYHAILRPATGEGFADHVDVLTNPLRYDATKGAGINKTSRYDAALSINSNYFELSGMQVSASNSTTTSAITLTLSGANCVAKDCILHGGSEATGVIDLRDGSKLINTVVIQESTKPAVRTYQNSPQILNCTFFCLGAGVVGIDQLYSPATIIKNTAVFGWTTSAETGTYGTSSNNASDDTSMPGTSNQDIKTASSQFENITNAANLDLRTKAGDLDENGVRDQVNTNDLDVVGQDRGTGTGTSAPTIGAWEVVVGGILPINVTGTISTGVTESDIVTGGKTIVLTIAGTDTFVTGTTSEDAIAAGISGSASWNSEVRDNLDNTNVALTGSDKVATVTLPASSGYSITANDTITATIPAASLTTTTIATVASPTFTITADTAGFKPFWISNIATRISI